MLPTEVHEQDVLAHYAFLKAYLMAFSETALPDLEHHKVSSPKRVHSVLRLRALCLRSTATFFQPNYMWLKVEKDGARTA